MRKYLLAGLLMLAAGPPAIAQEFLAGAHAGGEQSIDADDAEFVWGGFLRFKPVSLLGIEAAADVTTDTFQDGAIDTENVTVMGNILFYPIPDIFYISAGAGWTRADIDYSSAAIEDETEDQFAWNAGAGIEIPVLSWLSLTADARYVFRDLEFDNSTDPGVDDLNTDFWMVRAGLAIRFGGGEYVCEY